MTNQWLRLYAAFRNDPKVRTMSDTMQIRLVRLFCLRCESPTEDLSEEELGFGIGIEMFPETFHETLHETKGAFHETKSAFHRALHETKKLFLSKKFIDENWAITNWSKRQFTSDSSTVRVRKYRERKRLALNLDEESQQNEAGSQGADKASEGNVSRNVSSNVTETPRTEQNRDIKANTPISPTAAPRGPQAGDHKKPHASPPGAGGGSAASGRAAAAPAVGSHVKGNKSETNVLAPTAHQKGVSEGNGRKNFSNGMAPYTAAAAGHKNGAVGPIRSDPREAESKIAFFAFWKDMKIVGFEEPPWGRFENRAVRDFWRSNPKATMDTFKMCLRNLGLSEVNLAEPPARWLRELSRFAEGPVDGYRKSIKSRVH